MNPLQLLRGEVLPTHHKGALLELLSRGPWCHPPEAEGEGLSRRHRLPLKPPPLAPGDVPLLAVTPKATSLWVKPGPSSAPLSPSGGATLGERAQEAWQRASQALARSLPLVWEAWHPAQERPSSVKLWKLASLTAKPHTPELREDKVDGGSFGLSFFLSQASRLVGQAIRSDLLATASLDERGEALPVNPETLPQKVRGLSQMAPFGIRRLLVHVSQRQLALEAAAPCLEIIPITNAAEALGYAFDEPISDLLLERFRAQRHEFVDSIFKMVLGGKVSVLVWRPVCDAAELLLREPAEELLRWKLMFSHAIARRYDGHPESAPLPKPEWLQQFCAPLRIEILAHLVQQSTDLGLPPPDQAEALATPDLQADLRECFVPHLKLAGAVARLWAVTGKAPQAMQKQEELAGAFFERLSYEQVSYPLTEWLRLAGVLGDLESFLRAEQLLQKVQQRGGLGVQGNLYAELAHSRALCLLSQCPHIDASQALLERASTEAIEALQRICRNPALHLELRASALRWLRWALLHFPEQLDKEALERFCDSQHKASFAPLIELDRALHLPTPSAAHPEACIQQLEIQYPKLMAHLKRAAQMPEQPGDIPRYIAAFFPY